MESEMTEMMETISAKIITVRERRRSRMWKVERWRKEMRYVEREIKKKLRKNRNSSTKREGDEQSKPCKRADKINIVQGQEVAENTDTSENRKENNNFLLYSFINFAASLTYSLLTFLFIYLFIYSLYHPQTPPLVSYLSTSAG
jgi:hypothetical protein